MCLSGGAVAGLSSIHWTLCSLQGVAEALRAIHTQTRHTVLSTSLSAISLLSFAQYLPLMLGKDLSRVSELGSGLTYGSRLMTRMSPYKHHVLCDSSLEEILPGYSLLFLFCRLKKFVLRHVCIKKCLLEAAPVYLPFGSKNRILSLPLFLTLPDFSEIFL